MVFVNVHRTRMMAAAVLGCARRGPAVHSLALVACAALAAAIHAAAPQKIVFARVFPNDGQIG